MEKTLSQQLRRTELLNDKTYEVMGRLILKEFRSLDYTEFWTYDQDKQELIDTALNLGLLEVANIMIETT